MKFDRDKYFNMVRGPLFAGKLSQQQVDGQNAILTACEDTRPQYDLRWLGYELATTKHETASTMWPIEEYGKGAGRPYGKKDPETGFAYYGRGFVQLTWRENYAALTPILQVAFPNVVDLDLVWHPDQALQPLFATVIMFDGMEKGVFREGHLLSRYFNNSTEDPYNAREIINGDKSIVPSWSRGVSIGRLVASYYDDFLKALFASYIDDTPVPEPEPTPEPEPEPDYVTTDVTIRLRLRASSKVTVDDIVVVSEV